MRLAARTLALLAAPALLAAQSSPASGAEQLFRQGKYEEARAILRAQIARDRNDHVSLYWMGRTYVAEDKDGEAMKWLEQAVKLRDTSALYHLWLGNAIGGEAGRANKLRQPFLARRIKSEFERAVQLDPTLLDARLGLIEFYAQAPGVMGGSVDKAKEQAAEIAKLHPFRGHFADARIANRQKNVPAEEAAYKAAVAAMPDSATTFYNLATFYRRHTRWDEALGVYEALMARHPSEIPVHASWGVVASSSGKHLERGEREIKVYLASPPKDVLPATLSFVRYHLGQIYEKTERRELARAEYDEALTLNPRNADAKKARDGMK